jgi:hypothetical protein
MSADQAAPGQTPAATPQLVAAMGMYAATMLTVQSFELSLAGLVVAAEIGSTTPEQAWSAEIARLFASTWRLVHQSSAGSMENRLRGKVPPPLLVEIKALISWRNFLAHRYLRTRLYTAGPTITVSAKPDDLIELIALSNAFTAGNVKVTAATQEILTTHAPQHPVTPAEVQSSMSEFLKRLTFAQPPRFESIEATPSGDSA